MQTLLLLPLLVAGSVCAETITGQDRGAPYRIDMPDRWNGELVVLYHGYEVVGEPRPATMALGKPGQALFDQGFAIAQSSYAEQGWAVQTALRDTSRLRTLFTRRFHRPSRVFAIGGSFGAHLALAEAERAGSGYAGVLSTCGANVPAATLFGHIVDVLAGFDATFPRVLPLGADGLADRAAPAQLDAAAEKRMITALTADPAKAVALARFAGVRAASLPDTIWLYFAVLREMTARAGGFPVDNRLTQYSGFGDDVAFNRAVRRYAAVPAAASHVRRHVGLTGRTLVPVVVLDNRYDQLIPVKFQPVYAGLAAKAARADQVVQAPAVGEGHCNFQPDQVVGAFELLRDRVVARTAKRPAPRSVDRNARP